MGKNFSELPREFTSLVELLHWRAVLKPEQKAYSFLLDGEVEASYLTYGELDRQARSIAALLQSCGVKSGERGLLLYPPGLEFIAAFFGCLPVCWGNWSPHLSTPTEPIPVTTPGCCGRCRGNNRPYYYNCLC